MKKKCELKNGGERLGKTGLAPWGKKGERGAREKIFPAGDTGPRGSLEEGKVNRKSVTTLYVRKGGRKMTA